MAFNSDIRQFKTPAALAAYLQALPLPRWGVKGSTGHNTYRPTEAQWRGLASMRSMQATYEAKGWPAGPHYYVAWGAPNPQHDGIWQMTPPTAEGVHGVTCNTDHFGIELVGDFQISPPSAAQQVLFLDTIAALHRWAKIGPVFNMHRDCVPRTCPGDAFYALKSRLQAGLADRLEPPAPIPDPLRAEELPGPNKSIVYCSEASAAFYVKKGGFGLFGYPVKDEFSALGSNGALCSILVCERAVIKRPASPIEPVHLALLQEVKAKGWV